MKKSLVYFLIFIFLTGLMQAQDLLVATAANVQFAMNELESAFEQDTGYKIEPVLNSSGKLTAQILNGAPFDVFLSADMDYTQIIYKAGFAEKEPECYARGILILCTSESIGIEKGISVLNDPSIKLIAIAQPSTAPFGKAAMAVLEKTGFLENIKSKLVFGESIAQVNQYILSGAVDAAFTSKSTVIETGIQKQLNWIEVDSLFYLPLKQGIVILNYGLQKHKKAAESFYNFMFSAKARTILIKYGFRIE